MQTLLLGKPCSNCWRLFRQEVRVQILPNGFFCSNCKTFIARGRSGLTESLRIAGFFLLLMATFLLTKIPWLATQEVLWLGILAGYSFYFLSIFQHTQGLLIDAP